MYRNHSVQTASKVTCAFELLNFNFQFPGPDFDKISHALYTGVGLTYNLVLLKDH